MNDDMWEQLTQEMIAAGESWQDERALSLAGRVLKAIPAETADPELVAARLLAIRHQGDAARRLGQSDTALAYYRRYYELAGPESSHTVDALERLALLKKRRGDLAEAEDLLEQGLALARQLDYSLGRANILRERGNLVEVRGDPEAALAYYKQALAIYRSQQQLLPQMYAWTDIGLAHHDIGRLDKAADAYREALKFARSLHHPQTAVLLNNLGECYQDLFAMAQAREYHEEALSFAAQLPAGTGYALWVQADAGRNLGVDLYYLGEIEASRRYLQQTLALLSDQDETEIRPQVLFTLAFVELAEGNVSAAHQRAETLRSFAEINKTRASLARAFYLLGLCHQARNELTQAQMAWQQSQFMAQETGQRMLLWRVHAALGRVVTDPALAAVHYQIAAEIIQQVVAPIEDETLAGAFLAAPEVVAVLEGRR